MNLDKALLLVPTHCYDEFPVHHDGDEADELLACWTSLWHPQIVRISGHPPSWEKVDEQHGGLEKLLFVLPSISKDDATSSFRKRVETDEAILVEGLSDRDALVSRYYERLNIEPIELNDDIVRDFYALGYCFLQTELLTRNMRYSSNLNEGGFHTNLVAAAEAAIEGDHESVHTGLQSCFDMLTQEREHYYAVEVYLWDVAICSAKRPGDLADQLKATHKTNLLLPAGDIEQLANNDSLMETLRNALQNGETTVLGGEAEELATSLVPSEAILEQIANGLQIFEQHLNYRPRVFGRRRFGLSPTLPGILERFGYTAALHATFDDGRFPEATQTKSRWDGCDGCGLAAIMRAPLDATQSKTFLNLAGSISESMDMDHVATRCLAHPAGHVSPWFDEVRRVSKYTNGLGRFVTADEYFEESYDPGTHDLYKVSNYRAPYLVQSVSAHETDPISSVVQTWQRYVRSQQVRNLAFLSTMLGAKDDAYDGLDAKSCDAETLTTLQKQLISKLTRDAPDADGVFSVNALSFPVRRAVTTPHFLGREKPVYATHSSDGQHVAVIDTSSLGFASIPASAAKAAKSEPDMSEEHKIRNEFLECEVDAKTGGIRNIRSYQARSNQLSQQLAIRLGRPPNPQTPAPYSKVVADRVTTTASSPVAGEIVSEGRFLDEQDETLGTFQQTAHLDRGSRVLRIRVALDVHTSFTDDAWNSYVCSRFAWPNEAADLIAGVMDRSMPTTARRFEAPLFVDIDDASVRTTVISGGLPYHRRVESRKLDSLLMVNGETSREFEFGIGIGLANPARDALEFLSLPTILTDVQVPLKPQSGWLFHIDARNVVASSWEPIRREGEQGFRVKMFETNGRPTKVTLQAFRGIQSARKVDFEDATINTCTVNGDTVSFRIDGYEWAVIECLF
ncbi:MAG: hypothetical protein KDB27_20915 [Planctomycetales bacterium]|nr:hypothetical protein [Planctomycetales bacterium]